MKRTETIEKLATILEKQRQDLDNGSDYQDAQEVLDFLEQLGMKPPPVRAVLIRGKDYRWGSGCTMRCCCSECEPSYPMNEWEKE